MGALVQCLLPHVKSGRLHSWNIVEGYRLYFHRLYPRNEQAGRTFKWAFYIANHNGPHINNVLELQKVVIPYKKWDGLGIKVHIDGLTGSWDEMRGSAVLAETRMRINMPASLTRRDKEIFHVLFPCDADFPIDYKTLEYTGEVSGINIALDGIH